MSCLTSTQIEQLALEQVFSGSVEHLAHLAACTLCHTALSEMVSFY